MGNKTSKKFEIAAVPGASVTVGKNSKQNITQSEVSGNEFPEGLCCYALNLSSGFLPTDKFLEFRTSALKSVIGGSNHLFLWLDDNTSSLRVQEPNPNVIVRVRHNLFAVGGRLIDHINFKYCQPMNMVSVALLNNLQIPSQS